MKIHRKQWSKKKFFLLVLLLWVVAFNKPLLPADTVVIPGDVSRICYYSNYFYNFPTEDFLYYLNDRLLFWERPDDFIVPNGIRDRLLKIVAWHKILTKFVLNHAKEKENSVSFNLIDPDEYQDETGRSLTALF